MSKRTKAKQTAKGFSLNIGKSLWPIIRELTTPITFLEQISAKDREALGNSWSDAPALQKAKIMANIISGRITGINLFKDEYQTPQTLNPAAIINKWTTSGFGMWVYGQIPIKQLPLKAKFKAIGKRMMVGGGIGGLFDAKEGSSSSSSGTRHIQAPDMKQKTGYGNIVMQNRYINGSDSVRSSF